MKSLFTIAVMCFVIDATAQNTSSYHDWLKNIKEIPVKDSIHINIPEELPPAENPENIKTYITPLYNPDLKQAGHSSSYHTLGKITGSPDYNILLLYKYKFYNDSLIFRNLFLVTMDKKTGKQLHLQMVADNSVYRKDKSISNSWFFKNGLIKVNTRRALIGSEIVHNMEFTINSWGTIVAQPKWTAGAEKHEH